MQTDDSSNFLKHLADGKNWPEDQQFKYESPDSSPAPKTEPGTFDGLPPWVGGSEFPQQYDLVRRPPLIQNYCRRGEMVLLTATSKMGKSWYLMNQATCLAEGIPFLGMETAKSKVLYLDLELNQADAMDRFWSIALAMGLKSPPANLYHWGLRKYTYDISVIIETLNNRLPELGSLDAIYLDPWYMIGQSENFDENASSSVLQLLTELEKITLKTDASLFVSHHFRKGSMGRESHIDRGAGSGVMARMFDCIVSLTPHQLLDHAIFEMTSRSMRAPNPYVLKMTPPMITVADNADPNAYRRYGERPDIELTDECILELIPTGQPLTKVEWFNKAKMVGATDQNFETHFNSIKSNNLVQVVDRKGVTAYRKTSG